MIIIGNEIDLKDLLLLSIYNVESIGQTIHLKGKYKYVLMQLCKREIQICVDAVMYSNRCQLHAGKRCVVIAVNVVTGAHLHAHGVSSLQMLQSHVGASVKGVAAGVSRQQPGAAMHQVHLNAAGVSGVLGNLLVCTE